MVDQAGTRMVEGSETLVQEWMSPVVVTVNSDNTVHDVLEVLAKHRISAVPVVDNAGAFLGIATMADLVRAVIESDKLLDTDFVNDEDGLWAVELIKQRLGSELVSSVMTEVVATVTPEETMWKAARIMFGLGLHHLPVVPSKGKLKGMLSSMDFVKLVADSKLPV